MQILPKALTGSNSLLGRKPIPSHFPTHYPRWYRAVSPVPPRVPVQQFSIQRSTHGIVIFHFPRLGFCSIPTCAGVWGFFFLCHDYFIAKVLLLLMKNRWRDGFYVFPFFSYFFLYAILSLKFHFSPSISNRFRFDSCSPWSPWPAGGRLVAGWTDGNLR